MDLINKLETTTEALENKRKLLISSCGKEKYNLIVQTVLGVLRECNITPLVANDFFNHISQIYQLEHGLQ